MFVRILLIAALLWPGFAPAVASASGPVTPAGTTTTCCPLCVMSGAGGCGCGCSVEQEPARPADTADVVLPPDTPRQRTDEPSARPAVPSLRPQLMRSGARVFAAHAGGAAAACAWLCCWQT